MEPVRIETDRYLLLQADYKDTLLLVQSLGGADLICTSPPYCDARSYGNNVNWTFEDYQRLGDAVAAALKPGGHCLLNVDAPVREWRKGFGTERGFMPWKIMLDWAERVGLRIVERFAYGRKGHVGEYKGRFRNDWEPLFWFQRLGAEGYFDKWSIARPAKSGTYTGHTSTGINPDDSRRIRVSSGRAAMEGLTHVGTLWDYGHVGNGHDRGGEITEHPARFFTGLAEDIVRCFCPPGGLVVDPFVGSGTTAAAAIKYGRNFIGGDLFAREDGRPWIEIARDRIETCQ